MQQPAIHTAKLDRQRLEKTVKQVGGTLSAGFNCAVSAVGDRLGLYRAVAESGRCTSEALATRTGLHERWVREWLRHQACVGQLEYHATADEFEITPEAYAVLVNEDHPAFLAGGFDALLAAIPAVDHLEQSFKTGIGMSYDDHGTGCACGIERMGSFVPKQQLVSELIPLLDGVKAKLEAGAKVADIGCGSGVSTLEMAQAFPNSEFYGYEISIHALNRAADKLLARPLSNVQFLNARDEPLPADASFDLITTFDVIHDTPFPAALISAIHSALHKQGTWLCEDIKSHSSFAENLTDNPLAGLLFGFSVMVCMSSGMSEPGGAGLGTLGFNADVATEMANAAGFGCFRQLDFKNAMNNYYEIRKEVSE